MAGTATRREARALLRPAESDFRATRFFALRTFVPLLRADAAIRHRGPSPVTLWDRNSCLSVATSTALEECVANQLACSERLTG